MKDGGLPLSSIKKIKQKGGKNMKNEEIMKILEKIKEKNNTLYRHIVGLLLEIFKLLLK